MYQFLSTHPLPTGATAEIGVVVGPDPGDPWQIAPLLEHKGGLWTEHIVGALAEPLDKLVTRWYIASLDGLAIANVMLLEHASAAILGHVFCYQHHRRQGLAQAIFEQLLPDFRQRGGLRMTLGTGYDSHPYWLYHKHGFRPLLPESGFMKYEAMPEADNLYYSAGPTSPEPLTWRHWPTLAQLLADDCHHGLAAWSLNCWGPRNFEGPFLPLRAAVAAGEPVHVRVLERDSGAAVGLACLQRDRRWAVPVWLLDVTCHPRHLDQLPALLAALPDVDGTIHAWLPESAEARRQAVTDLGVVHQTTFPGGLPDGGAVALHVRPA